MMKSLIYRYLRQLYLVLAIFVVGGISSANADDLCIDSGIQHFKLLKFPSKDDICNGFLQNWFIYTKGVRIKGIHHITNLEVTIADKDIRPILNLADNMMSGVQLDGEDGYIPNKGEDKSNATDNADHYCHKEFKVLPPSCETKCVDDPNYRAEKVDNIRLGDILPFLSNVPFVGDFSLFSDGHDYHMPSIYPGGTYDLKKWFSGPSGIMNGIFDWLHFWQSQIVYASYEKDGKRYENVILNRCGSTVPDVEIHDSSIYTSSSPQTMRFTIDISGELSGEIAEAYNYKSYIHYHTEDGTAKAGVDYQETKGILVINQGDSEAHIDVPIKANARPGEFFVVLDNALGARINDGNATGTIYPTYTEESNATKPICNTFADMFQTRKPCNDNGGGLIDFTNAGSLLDNSTNVIIDSSDDTLMTCRLNTKQWVKDDYQTCGDRGDCKASGTNAQSIIPPIDYNHPPVVATVNNTPSYSNENVNLSGTSTLPKEAYNKVETPWEDTSTTFTAANNLLINKLYLTHNDHIYFNAKRIEIGQIGLSSKTDNIIKTSTTANDIRIRELKLAANTTINLQAKHTIVMDTFEIGHANTHVTLKAKYININNFNIEKSGNGDDADITIYADYVDIGSLTFSEHSKVKIKPYTPGKRILFRSNNIHTSSTSTLEIDSGNYYVMDELYLHGTGESVKSIIASDQNQLINLYINNDFNPQNNPGINALGKNGKFGSNPPANFMIFVNGDLKTGGGGTTFNATIYVEGDVELGNPTYIKGAVSAQGSIKVGQGQFFYDQNINNTGWGECKANITTYETGPFDAWDTFRDVNDRNISTKIAGENFDLTIASINPANDGTETKDGIDVKYNLIDIDTNTTISSWSNYNATNHATITSEAFNIPDAHKRARVVFWVCSDYNSTKKNYILSPFADCTVDCPSLQYDGPDEPCRRYFSSSDEFAVRPDHFVIDSIASPIRAGEDFNVTLHAVDPAGQDVEDYNETVNILGASPSLDYNESKPICLTGSLNNVNGAQFADGKATVTLKYSEVGKLKLLLTEHDADDFAHTDVDDTDFNSSRNDSGNHDGGPIYRQIESADTTVDFVVDHFDITNISLHDQHEASDVNFTYLAKDETTTTLTIDKSMAAHLDMNITAQNDQNNTTANYNHQCYAKSTDLNISYLINGAVASSGNPGNLNKILYRWFDDNTTANESEGNKDLNDSLAISGLPKEIFNTDHNGTALIKVQLNFDRNYTNAVNPFKLHIVDINISDGDGSDKNDSVSAEHNATFYYARVHPSKFLYDDVSENSVVTPVSVEVYSDDPTIMSNPPFKMTGNYMWYLNTAHTQADGNLTLVSTDTTKGTVSGFGTAPSSGVYSGVTVTAVPGSTRPLMVDINLTGTDPWLIYNPNADQEPAPFYRVRFINSGGWTGEGKTGHVVGDDINTKKTRRLDW